MNQVHALLKFDYAYSRNIFGKNIGIAVLDTGVYAGHPDLMNRIVQFKDFINNRRDPYDDNGHGTHVCGILCGSGKASGGVCMGIAPLADVVCLKVLDRKGNGSTGDVLNACRWILANHRTYGIRIVNISVGTVCASRRSEDDELIRGVEQLWDEGLTVVAAAGNNGPRAGSITIPGISRKIITVGSLEEGECLTDCRRQILYSGRGPTKECVVKPEVIARGTDVMSCANYGTGYVKKSGTSMAAPVVSGCIALLMECRPELKNSEIKMRLYERAADMGLPRERQGWGMIQVERLLKP